MGETRPGGSGPVPGGSLIRPAARVVPNIPSFAVDDGFWYSIPDHLADKVAIGSIVRVPLSGRRVRGWVVETAERATKKLKEIAGAPGVLPVFDRGLAGSLLWAAHHYVAPVPVLLAKASPPNLPRGEVSPISSDVPHLASSHPLTGAAVSSAAGKRAPTTALVGRWQSLDWIEALAPILAAGKSALVLAGSGAEVGAVHERAHRLYGDRALGIAGDDDAELTRSWELAQVPGRLVVGTPRVALWHVSGLALSVVLEEGRRSMKDRQTPTLHVRDVIRTRSRTEGFNAVFFGPTPSVELLAAGAAVVDTGRRPWGLVEVVDRSGDKPGAGSISDQALAALRATISRRGESVFVLTSHRSGPRVVDEINTRLGDGVAALLPEVAPVMVGSEGDLTGLPPVSLAVASNVDALTMATGYRAGEEALRQLARLANTLRPGRGRRVMLQTEDPGSDLVTTLRRGDPVPYLERVLVERAHGGLPPSRDMIALEIRGEPISGIESEIAGLGPVEILGPMSIEAGRRWLLSGDLTKVRDQLRALVGRWRERGAVVRVDADPIDF
jgi:primosomal protein N'